MKNPFHKNEISLFNGEPFLHISWRNTFHELWRKGSPLNSEISFLWNGVSIQRRTLSSPFLWNQKKMTLYNNKGKEQVLRWVETSFHKNEVALFNGEPVLHLFGSMKGRLYCFLIQCDVPIICIYMHICIYVYIHIYIYIHVYKYYMYISSFSVMYPLYAYICIYVYIYIYTYTYTYMYKYYMYVLIQRDVPTTKPFVVEWSQECQHSAENPF